MADLTTLDNVKQWLSVSGLKISAITNANPAVATFGGGHGFIVGDFIELTITANAFLHHMVRNIVGSLVEIGIGRKPVPWLSEVLDARRRELAAPTYSPAGLYLAGVEYEAWHGVTQTILDPLSPSPASQGERPDPDDISVQEGEV
jgi:hypothetical protein